MITAARSARGDDAIRPDPGWGGVELHVLHGLLGLANEPIVDRPPYRAAGLRYLGPGAQTGGEFAYRFTVRGFRFGETISVWAASGVGVGHTPRWSDVQTSLGKTPIAVDTALSFGYELDLGRVRPYLDGRLGFGLFNWSIAGRSARLGALPELHGWTWYPIFEPRLGVAFQLFENLALDVGFSGSPLGFARLTTFAGVAARWGLPKRPPGDRR
ncbi:MAG: hypothetical protein QM820_62115 [Minicystis sp.]